MSTFTADSLIEAFGDQAYHKGVKMAVEALRSGDQASCRELAKANIKLLQRGYHKNPEATVPSANDEKPQTVAGSVESADIKDSGSS
jgi:hypothetical protein